MNEWIRGLFRHPELLRMGHHQRAEDLNLGLGWLYYALGRALRPAAVVVIGSYRGFVPLVLGKALADNLEGGTVTFIDPSLVDNFWKEPDAVRRWFEGFGVRNVRHFPMTTQQFVETDEFRILGPVGILFIDGYHSLEQARFDHHALDDKLAPGAETLFHDSASVSVSRIYGEHRAYERRVKDYIDELRRDPALQVLDLPLAQGVTLVFPR